MVFSDVVDDGIMVIYFDSYFVFGDFFIIVVNEFGYFDVVDGIGMINLMMIVIYFGGFGFGMVVLFD